MADARGCQATSRSGPSPLGYEVFFAKSFSVARSRPAGAKLWIALQRNEAAKDLGEDDAWTTPYLSFDVFYTSVLADEEVFGTRSYDSIDRAFHADQ